jgi:hypothetical protein
MADLNKVFMANNDKVFMANKDNVFTADVQLPIEPSTTKPLPSDTDTIFENQMEDAEQYETGEFVMSSFDNKTNLVEPHLVIAKVPEDNELEETAKVAAVALAKAAMAVRKTRENAAKVMQWLKDIEAFQVAEKVQTELLAIELAAAEVAADLAAAKVAAELLAAQLATKEEAAAKVMRWLEDIEVDQVAEKVVAQLLAAQLATKEEAAAKVVAELLAAQLATKEEAAAKVAADLAASKVTEVEHVNLDYNLDSDSDSEPEQQRLVATKEPSYSVQLSKFMRQLNEQNTFLVTENAKLNKQLATLSKKRKRVVSKLDVSLSRP